jgi:hypothetical protein
MPDGELDDPVTPAFFDVLFSVIPLLVIVPFVILFVGALVSIRRRSTAMSGFEELGWYAFVVFAQVIGPAVWFLFARERYEWAAASQRSPRLGQSVAESQEIPR